MSKRFLIIGLFLLLFITSLIGYFGNYSHNSSKMPVPEKGIKLECFKVDTGWGYRIIKDGRVFINQENIPAISGVKSFASEEEARKVGKIVLRRVENRESPTIELAELKNLRISYL